MRVFKNLFHSLSLLAAIHLFISSHNEIKDFCSMEKMAAVTFCVHNTKQSIRILQPPPYLQGIFDEKRLDERF